MISLDCTHPDLEEFIDIKTDLNKVTSANISVKVTNDFMEAVLKDEDWELSFTRPETNETITKTVKAAEIFEKLCENNWNYAEPGILYWDTINNWNLLSNNPNFQYAGVNPCAEEPLPAGGSCLLGALNLAEFVENGEFNYIEFRNAVIIAVRALNEVLDEGLEKHPLQEQRDSVRDLRQIGLGIMGLADMLIKMNINYDSPDALHLCDGIAHTMCETAILGSSGLAREFGTYPQYTPQVMLTPFFKSNVSSPNVLDSVERYGLRNSQLLTIAPTGTISTMLGVSGGIEPIFANSYTRTTKSLHNEDVEYKVFTPIVKDYMESHNITDEKDLPDFFITAKDLDVFSRLMMQSIWQRYIDASISSTINLPEDTTVDEIMDLYTAAWEYGLKGVTIFRENCKRTAILNDKPKENEEVAPTKVSTDNLKTIGLERHLTTGCGSLHVCAYFDEYGNLKNTYLSKGSTGGCNNFMIGLSRMISLAARNGVKLEDIIDQLNSCGTCPSYAVRRATKKDASPGSCCPVAIGNALLDMRSELSDVSINHCCDSDIVITDTDGGVNKDVCPECGAELEHEMGCVTCRSCGYSKCG